MPLPNQSNSCSRLSWRDVDVSRPLVVTYKATYPPYSSTVVNSRFVFGIDH